jgi:hypothetical protein
MKMNKQKSPRSPNAGKAKEEMMAKKISKTKAASDPDASLPQEHVPSGLKPPEPPVRTAVDYVCAFETTWKGDKPRTDFEVWAGPYLDPLICLERHPAKDRILAVVKTANAVIVRRKLDGTDEVLYRWKQTMTDPGKWVREKK